MATAPRTRPTAGAKPTPRRARSAPVGMLVAFDNVRPYLLPGLAALVIIGGAVLERLELISVERALAAAIVAALVLLLTIALRPLLEPGAESQARLLGGGLAAIWLVALYVPFHARLFPGTALVSGVQVSADGKGLPLRVPAAGHRAVDLLLEGKLAPNPNGGVAPPVHFHLTIAGMDGAAQTVDGVFEDSLRTQRLGRRGTAVVHQTHTADVRVLPNPGRQDLNLTQLTLDPASSQPITISVFAHPLPPTPVLALLGLLLVGGVAAFDRLGPVPETDGALTLSTLAVVGTAIVFWTSNAVHPDFSTLIGSAIFGGPFGFGAGALVWWIAKRLVVRPAA